MPNERTRRAASQLLGRSKSISNFVGRQAVDGLGIGAGSKNPPLRNPDRAERVVLLRIANWGPAFPQETPIPDLIIFFAPHPVRAGCVERSPTGGRLGRSSSSSGGRPLLLPRMLRPMQHAYRTPVRSKSQVFVSPETQRTVSRESCARAKVF